MQKNNLLAQKNTRQKSKIRIAAVVLITGLVVGCGGGGSSSHASSSGNNSGTVQGVVTPSNLSVVTAQNANAGS